MSVEFKEFSIEWGNESENGKADYDTGMAQKISRN